MKQKEEKKQIGIGKIKDREIVDEMKESYIDYAMSVIVARALPDVRDGLKPVHRRILYAMLEEGLRHSARFRKSATVVGSVLGRYHPHGDIAVYDSLVRMAQDFSLRYPLVDGQGNFGCFTKDTKVKLTDGRSLNFEELINEDKKGKTNYTFSFNFKTKKIEIAKIKNPILTKKNEKIIEITLDNEEKVKCTSNHKFMLRNGRYKEARNLKTKDSLMSGYFNLKQIGDGQHYLSVLQSLSGKYEFVHKLADEYNQRIKKIRTYLHSFILHHKDFYRFNNNPENIQRMSFLEHYKIHFMWSKNLWKIKGNEFREKHRQSLKKTFSNPEIREKISERSKELWRNFEYRKKYPMNHFQRMAEKLWENPAMKEFHRSKIIEQRKNPEFIEKNKESLRIFYKKRIKENPNLMKELAKKAGKSLLKKWRNPEYKNQIIRNKILKYVNFLLKRYPRSKITPDIYNKERYNNCFPKFENALKYFPDFSEVINKAEKYNHKIVSIKVLKKREDVYDLTIDNLHNFLLDVGIFVHNSIDGDSAASMRYSEAKLSAIGENMLEDIEKNTVDFMDNYDGTRKEPRILPSPLPQLLLNGSFGIAVGMATSVPTHNLSEVVDALIYLIDEPKADTEDLFKFIQGPDFPTGGIIFGKKDIISAYSQGKGAIVTRGKAEIVEQEKTGRSQIIIREIPYEVSKSALVEKLAELVQEKKIEGIKDIRDESDREEKVRIVIELQKNSYPQKILNRLYKFSDLQKTFYLNMLALVDGIQPRVLSLVDLLNYFIEHRKKVVFRRTQYDLDRAKERAHILEGLHKCLARIDEVIKTIKNSKDRQDALQNLIKKFKLTEIQANAILETKLAALAKLEREKIEQELKELKIKIKEYTEILASPKKIKEIIKKELKDLKERFGDQRKTKVVVSQIGEIAEEDLIPQEETVITLTQGGYIKRTKPTEFKIQKRGGKGIVGMKTLQEDIVEHFLLCQTHDSLLFFTDSGKVFRTLAYEIPEGNRVARGRGLLNFLELSNGEKILSILAIGKEDIERGVKDLIMVTEKGIVKRTNLEEFKNVRRSGLIAIKLKKDDLLKKVVKSTGDNEVIITTKKGQSIRFKEKDIREMGRTASGVRGIRLKKGDKVVGMDVIENQKSKTKDQKENKQYLLVVTENGYGKQTDIKEYRLQGRGGSGIKTVNVTSKTGELAGAWIIGSGEEDLIVISQKGHVIRTEINSIAKLSRATQGVRVMRLDPGDKVASATCI